MDNDSEIHLAPERIRFSLFTAEEMKKMCVTQIITPLTLDALGHPLPGGLYDRKLGKSLLSFYRRYVMLCLAIVRF